MLLCYTSLQDPLKVIKFCASFISSKKQRQLYCICQVPCKHKVWYIWVETSLFIANAGSLVTYLLYVAETSTYPKGFKCGIKWKGLYYNGVLIVVEDDEIYDIVRYWWTSQCISMDTTHWTIPTITTVKAFQQILKCLCLLLAMKFSMAVPAGLGKEFRSPCPPQMATWYCTSISSLWTLNSFSGLLCLCLSYLLLVEEI